MHRVPNYSFFGALVSFLLLFLLVLRWIRRNWRDLFLDSALFFAIFSLLQMKDMTSHFGAQYGRTSLGFMGRGKGFWVGSICGEQVLITKCKLIEKFAQRIASVLFKSRAIILELSASSMCRVTINLWRNPNSVLGSALFRGLYYKELFCSFGRSFKKNLLSSFRTQART